MIASCADPKPTLSFGQTKGERARKGHERNATLSRAALNGCLKKIVVSAVTALHMSLRTTHKHKATLGPHHVPEPPKAMTHKSD